MNEINLEKVPTDNTHSVLQDFLSKREFIPVIFFSPYTLNTWLTHAGKSLYLATNSDESVLVVHKEQNNDIRVLFDHPSNEMRDLLMEHFKPRFFAVNECPAPPKQKNYLTSQEAEISLIPIANLEEKGVRKKYNQFISSENIQSYLSKNTSQIMQF